MIIYNICLYFTKDFNDLKFNLILYLLLSMFNNIILSSMSCCKNTIKIRTMFNCISIYINKYFYISFFVLVTLPDV